METQEKQSLPATLSSPLRARDFWVMTSFMVVLLGSLAIAFYILQTVIFHFQDKMPVREQPHFGLFIISMSVIIVVTGIAAKYLWLIALSFLVGISDVSPWIAYGFPRRIHPYDKAFLEKFYRRPDMP